jgi:flagellar basal body P-ring protein FlgI
MLRSRKPKQQPLLMEWLRLPMVRRFKIRTQITVEEEQARTFVFDPGVELSSIVDALNSVGGSPSDLVAILEALREAGSLRAELIVI